jgi:anti-anti-sigma regulatory factor
MGERGGAGHDVDLRVAAIGGVLALTLEGSVDGGLARKLAACLDQAVRSRRPVVVELSGVTQFGPQAVAALQDGYRRLGTRMHLVAPRDRPAWAALRAAGVSHLFVVHASRAAALTAAAPR